MHSTFNRRTAIKVKDGRVQRKNRCRPTGHEGNVLDRESPGRGFRNVVTKRDIQNFVESSARLGSACFWQSRGRGLALWPGGWGIRIAVPE